MPRSSWSHDQTFPLDARSASASRTFVRLRLADHDLLHLCEQVELVTSELTTNAIRHARTPFAVSLRGDGEGSVRLTVTDAAGVEFSAPGAKHWSSPGGLGLLLAASMSSAWGVDHGNDGTTAVWASFDAVPQS